MNILQRNSDRIIYWSGAALLASAIHIYALWLLSSFSMPVLQTNYPAAVVVALSAEPEFMQHSERNSVVGITQSLIESAVEQLASQSDEVIDLPALPEQPEAQLIVVKKEPVKAKRPQEKVIASHKPIIKGTQEHHSKPSPPVAASSAMLSGVNQQVAAAISSDSSLSQQAELNWKSRLQGHLIGFKRYPSSARKQQRQGTATIRFMVDKNGYVSAAKLTNSSGVPALDREALAIIKRAEPLPKPPAELLSNGQITLSLPVDFNLKRK